MAYSLRMVTLARMGRKKLGRKPFNLTMPDDIRDTTQRQAAIEHRTASALVEELLRGYMRKQGVSVVADETSPAPARRKARP